MNSLRSRNITRTDSITCSNDLNPFCVLGTEQEPTQKQLQCILCVLGTFWENDYESENLQILTLKKTFSQKTCHHFTQVHEPLNFAICSFHIFLLFLLVRLCLFYFLNLLTLGDLRISDFFRFFLEIRILLRNRDWSRNHVFFFGIFLTLHRARGIRRIFAFFLRYKLTRSQCLNLGFHLFISAQNVKI